LKSSGGGKTTVRTRNQKRCRKGLSHINISRTWEKSNQVGSAQIQVLGGMMVQGRGKRSQRARRSQSRASPISWFLNNRAMRRTVSGNAKAKSSLQSRNARGPLSSDKKRGVMARA